MAIYNTRKLVEEIKLILEANKDITKVSTDAVTPVAAETSEAAVYISLEEIVMTPRHLNTNSSGYDRHMMINLYCNYDSSNDPLDVYTFIDSVERSILEDSTIWVSLIDRDLIAVDFDNQAHAPKRSITMLFDIMYRMECS